MRVTIPIRRKARANLEIIRSLYFLIISNEHKSHNPALSIPKDKRL